MSIKFELVPYTRGVGIEISERSDKTFPHFIKWHSDGLDLLTNQSFDFAVFINETPNEDIGTLIKIAKKVKQNGYICIICSEEISVHSLVASFESGMSIKENVKNEGVRFLAIQKLDKQITELDLHTPSKTCAVLRYGGIGDMMMCSHIFPLLKEQGYHVTLYTHPNSYEVVKLNPYIDRFILQDSGQVPIEWFREFCEYTSKKYDKFINLSESIEGSLLSLPDRVSYYWPTQARHDFMNRSYYELTSLIADVPYDTSGGKFYSSPKERVWAEKHRKKMSEPVILYVLSGSSTHKFWPYQDQLIAQILLMYPTATILLVGDDASKLLERGWENEPRVKMKAGKWSVRQTMTFCSYVDIIITPETGVFLAEQFGEVPIILLHSHSSPGNYAEELPMCISITPDECDCYPCHKLHYGSEHCSMVEVDDIKSEEVGYFAECQLKISQEKVFNAIEFILNKEED